MTTPDGQAGRLNVDVVGDTKGFARDLQAKIDAEVRNVRARIKVEIDSKGLARDVREAADRASRNAKIRVGVEVDSKGLTAGLRDAIRRAESNVRAIRVRVEIDSKGLTKSVREATAKAEKEARVRVEVDANTARVSERLAALRAERPSMDVEAHLDTSVLDRELEAARARARVQARDSRGRFTSNGGGGGGGGGDNGGGGIGGALSKMPNLGKVAGALKLPAMAAGIGMLVSLAAQAAAGLFAMGQAAAQAAGLIGLIPAAGMGLGLVVGTIMAGLKGVGEASKAMGKAQAGSGAAAAAQAAAQEAAAHRVEQAQRGLASAVQQADRTQIDSARAVAAARQNVADTIAAAGARVATAEQTLAASQRNAKTVQDALTKARKDAKDSLDDLVLSLKGAALDEEAAGLAVERAREALDKANRSATSTDLDRREADLAYRQALQSLAEIQAANADLKDSADAQQKAGVDGNAAVVAAQDAVKQQVIDQKAAEKELADARAQQAKDVKEAQFQLTRAIEDSTLANRDAVQSIADAKYELADAQKAATKASQDSGSAASAAALAMANLSPAGQRFVTFLQTKMKPALKAVRMAAQEALLPPLQGAMTTLLGMQGPLTKALSGTGAALGYVAQQAAKTVMSGPFQKDFASAAGESTNAMRAFAPVLNGIIRSFGILAAAGAPTITRITKAMGLLSGRMADYLSKQQAIGVANPKAGLAGFFDRAYTAAAQLGRIMADVVAGFVNIGKASGATSRGLMTSLEGATQRFREFTAEPETQKRFAAFFERSAETTRELGRLIVDLTKTLFRMGEAIDVAPIVKQIRTELLPAFEQITTTSANAFGPQLVDLLTNITKAIANLSAGGGGGLAGFIGTLNLFAEALVAITSIPGVGTVLGTILKALGALGAVSLVAGQFVRIFGPAVTLIKEAIFLWPAWRTMLIQAWQRMSALAASAGRAAAAVGRFIASMARQAAATMRTFAASLLTAVKNMGRFLASMARTAILRAFAAGMWLVNAAMSANPLVLLAIALVALVAAFVIAYQKSETFRNIVKGALEAVGNAASWLFGWFKSNWPLLLAILTGPFGLLVLLIVRNFGRIRSAVTDVIGWVRKNWPLLLAILTGPFGLLVLWVSRNFGAIRSAVGGVFTAVRTAVAGFLSNVRGGFETAVNAIQTAWARVREAVAAPIRFVVNTIYNQGIRRAWNSVAGLVGFGQLPEYKLAGGGKIPGYAPGKDKVHTLLSPGEGVLTPQATSMVGGASGIRAINDAAGRRASQKPAGEGATAFKGGGILGGIVDVGKGVVGGVKNAAGAVGGVISAGAKWTINHVLSTVLYPLRKLLEELGGTTVGRVLKGALNNLITGVADKVKSAVPGLRRGATILPRKGGTLANVAEAGRSEAIVDEGLLNKRMSDMENLAELLKHLGTSVTIEDGAIRLTVVNPVGETTEQTLNSRLRVMGSMGLFEAKQPSDA